MDHLITKIIAQTIFVYAISGAGEVAVKKLMDKEIIIRQWCWRPTNQQEYYNIKKQFIYELLLFYWPALFTLQT